MGVAHSIFEEVILRRLYSFLNGTTLSNIRFASIFAFY